MNAVYTLRGSAISERRRRGNRHRNRTRGGGVRRRRHECGKSSPSRGGDDGTAMVLRAGLVVGIVVVGIVVVVVVVVVDAGLLLLLLLGGARRRAKPGRLDGGAQIRRDSSSFNLFRHLEHDSSTTTAMTDDTANPMAMPTNVVAPMPFFSSKMRSRVAEHHPKSKLQR